MFNQDALNEAVTEALALPNAELARLVTLAGCPSYDLSDEQRAAYCNEAAHRLTRTTSPGWVARYEIARCN